jgi:glycosyltransferase 2 family protein
MKIGVIAAALIGLALAVWLLLHIGVGQVFAAVASIGIGGFVLVVGYGLFVVMLLGTAWYVLVPCRTVRDLATFIIGRQTRDSAGDVLPFSQLGGIVIGVRAAIVYGVSPPLACASMIVDVTVELLAQIGYVALGLALLSARAPRNSLAASLSGTVMTTLLVATVAAALFIVVQRYTPRIANRLAAPVLRGPGRAIRGIGAALDAIYRAPGRIALSLALHFTAWVASAAVAWLGLLLIGARVNLGSVIALESLVYAARSVAVFVPNALGVQEGAYALLAPVFGISTEFALALSLLKRARDIAVGVPVLLVWQKTEARRSLGLAGPGTPAPPAQQDAGSSRGDGGD